jgi:hypothetical protein
MSVLVPKWYVRTTWGAFEYHGVIDYTLLYEKGHLAFFTREGRMICVLAAGQWMSYAAVSVDENGNEYFPVDVPNCPEFTGSFGGPNPEENCNHEPPCQTPHDPGTNVVTLRPRARTDVVTVEPPPFDGPPAAGN